MAINSALPTEAGMMLWSSWSSDDPDFEDEWKDDNPCEHIWHSFKGNGVGLGTLIHLADLEDPHRHRFSEDLAKAVKSAEDKQVQEYRQSTLDYEEVIKRAFEILKLDNPAEVNYKLNTLALQAGYRDQTALEKLIVDQIAYEEAQNIMTSEVDGADESASYLIPDVLPHPSVILIYGAGGDGKSMSLGLWQNTSLTGKPFKVRGATFQCKRACPSPERRSAFNSAQRAAEEADFPITEKPSSRPTGSFNAMPSSSS